MHAHTTFTYGRNHIHAHLDDNDNLLSDNDVAFSQILPSSPPSPNHGSRTP